MVLARTEEQLARAISVRWQAYDRHLPEVARELHKPEREDYEPGSIVLLAESKADGTPLGTLRIQTNLWKQVEFEEYLPLPAKYRGQVLAHIARLGITKGKSATLVKLALFKAMHRYCLANQVAYLLVVGVPPRDRWYDQLSFSDIFDEKQLFLVPSSHGFPGRMMSFEVASAERRWRESNHPLYNFMFREFTRDIEVFSSLAGSWVTPRSQEACSREPHESMFNIGLLAV